MSLTPTLHTQLWLAIHRLHAESGAEGADVANVILQNSQTNSVALHVNAVATTSTSSGQDKISTAFSQNLNGNATTQTNGNFDALDIEFACYNEQSTIGHLITMILYSIVCIFGLFGNTLVIYVVMRFSKMQTVTNIYILNLAIADECFLIGIPFLLYTMQKGSWQFGEYMCKAYMVSTSVTQFTSSIFLLIMAADRYIAVCHPIASPRFRTAFVSKIVSGCAWLMSAVFMLPVMIFATSVEINDHVSCNIKWPEMHNAQPGSTFIWYTLTLGFATPLTFIMVFYFLVIRKLHSVELKHKSKEKKRSHRKVTKLVMTVIAVYICCWLPYWVAQLVLISKKTMRCVTALEILVFLLVGCLSYSNSAMNPLLYAFLSDNFKKSFLRAFSCAGRMRKDGVTGEQQPERSIFPKWGTGHRHHRTPRSRGEDGDESGYDGVSGNKMGSAGDGNVTGSARCGGTAGGGGAIGKGNGRSIFGNGNGNTYRAANSRRIRRSNASSTSRFLGTSTAGGTGTGMTATSIMDDDNSDDISPMETMENDDGVCCVDTITSNAKGGHLTSVTMSTSGIGSNSLAPSKPPVLQTDL